MSNKISEAARSKMIEQLCALISNEQTEISQRNAVEVALLEKVLLIDPTIDAMTVGLVTSVKDCLKLQCLKDVIDGWVG